MQLPAGRGRKAAAWGLKIAAGLFFLYIISLYYKPDLHLEDTYRNIIKKNEILSQMRVQLLTSLELEKDAVMAQTDEESQQFADQSRAAAEEVGHNLQLLRALTAASPLQDEKKLVVEFDTCWTELRKLDQVILALAVQNTNLKAASLSREKGTATMQQFEEVLDTLPALYAGKPNEAQVVRYVGSAIIAGLKIFNLHCSHIAEASDANMDQIEQQMKTEEAEAAKSLDALGAIVEKEHQTAVMQAQTAFADFMKVTGEVINLSRQNSNVKSLELSLGRKRRVAAQCDEILTSFQKTVQSRTFQATR